VELTREDSPLQMSFDPLDVAGFLQGLGVNPGPDGIYKRIVRPIESSTDLV
jgi:hypothetical protein